MVVVEITIFLDNPITNAGGIMPQKSLVTLGDELASIDEEIIGLLADRMQIAREIELIKRDHPISIIRPDIERMRMSQYVALAEELGVSVSFIMSIFYQIHGESIKVQLAQLQEDFQESLASNEVGG